MDSGNPLLDWAVDGIFVDEEGVDGMENTEKKWNIGQGGDMPIGFGLSLAANAKSMEAFSNMTDEEKTAVVEKSRHMQSRAEMENYVNQLGKSGV